MTVQDRPIGEPVALREVTRATAREAVVGLDVARSLVAAVDGAAVPQTRIARLLGVSPSAVNQRVQAARSMPPARPGFSGASPLEIAQRYAAGELEWAQVLEELARWPYEERQMVLDDVTEWNVAGTGDAWSELGIATRRGYLTYEEYGQIQQRVEAAASDAEG
ncbi:hypothetical protein PZ938_00050 [Luteipulveratus sp. YIM 133132]|uniref:hypothetical protein n=1 Tax=Luteipulveratus flavus TaxID=3031728 RepID=UPI0023AEB78B|nr:hypothetical protein [Luteipulveratus sp. YIM 133132]MDE9363985.1 hypothetical protein [Luteipulveratus sp. YIM 133132]